MKRTFKISDSNGNHTYTVKVQKSTKETIYTLRRSKNITWTIPKEKVLTAIDNGSTIEVIDNLSKGSNSVFEYHEMIEMRILFDVISRADCEDKYKIKEKKSK